MYGAFQSGVVMELGQRLQSSGYGSQPFDLTIGSSSGSLVATVAAAGGPFDHNFVRNAWVEFGEATKIRPRTSRPFNPYPQALQNVFERGLVNTEKASRSRTHLIVTASEYETDALANIRSAGYSALASGLKRFLTPDCDSPCDFLEKAGAFLEAGACLFAPVYYSNKPVSRAANLQDLTFRLTQDAQELRRAVEASSRIPFLYGIPLKEGGKHLIDGVFANNAPVELALELGVRNVFVVTSSKKGLVFDRPIQSLAKRQALNLLKQAEKAPKWLARLPRGRHILNGLRTLASVQDKITEPKPLDLDALRRRYPKQRIGVIHPQEDIGVSRFFETRPEVLARLYEMGRESARNVLIPVTQDAWEPTYAA